MHQMIWVSLLLAPLAHNAAHSVSEVPDRFVGRWAANPSMCDNEADRRWLDIRKTHIAYAGSHGPILAAVVRGREIALVAELSGDDGTRLATAKFVISAHGTLIAERSGAAGETVTRYRCPD